MPERNEATKKSHEQDTAGPSHDAGNADHARYSKPTSEEADRIVASKLGPSGAAGQPWVDVGAAGPQKVDVGDQEIGSQTFHEAIVWNTETVEANVSARVDGNPAIQLISAPDRIFPSRDGVDPSNKIRLVFSPTAKGRVSGTLRVDLSWRAGARAPAQLVIPIEGAAHAPGSQTLAEEQAAQRQQEQQQGEAAERDAQQKRREAREDEDWKTHRTHGDQQSRDALDTATAGAQIALHSLFENRRTGVDVAWEDAKQYVKAQPRHEESLLESLAMAGLEIATAGIAGAVAKRLEGPLEKILTAVTQAHSTPKGEAIAASTVAPAKYVVALITDGMKQGIKSVGKGMQPGHSAGAAATHHAEQDGAGPLSENPMTGFFGSERVVLNGDHAVEAHRLSARTKAELAPMLDSPGEAPRNAVRAMDKITDEITAMNQGQEAAVLQAQASALHWVRYLAQASLGSVSPETAQAAGKRTDAHGQALTDTTEMSTRGTSGLVDVTFAASVAHPENPATVRGVFVQGVSNAIAHRLARQSLMDAGVAVRARGTPSDGDASMPVMVTRDEAGNLTYSDQTHPPGAAGASWLARKAGDLHGGPSAELRGARKLMEDDLMNKRIPESLITTDSADGTGSKGH